MTRGAVGAQGMAVERDSTNDATSADGERPPAEEVQPQA